MKYNKIHACMAIESSNVVGSYIYYSRLSIVPGLIGSPASGEDMYLPMGYYTYTYYYMNVHRIVHF